MQTNNIAGLKVTLLSLDDVVGGSRSRDLDKIWSSYELQNSNYP